MLVTFTGSLLPIPAKAMAGGQWAGGRVGGVGESLMQ